MDGVSDDPDQGPGPDQPEPPDEPDEPDESNQTEDSGEPDEGAARPPLPRAAEVVSRPIQIAVAAGAIVVLLVVALVLVVQDSSRDRTRTPGAQSPGVTTEVPSEPPATYEPSRTESLPPIPGSICPNLTIEHPFTVITFNIHGGLGRGGSRQLDRIAAEIKAWKPDVALLQEVDDGRRRSGGARQAEVLGGLTDLSWVYAGNQQRPDGGPIGNAILSRYPVKEWANIKLPRAGGKEQRGLLHAVLDVQGTEVSVYATHFDHRSSGARLAQARAVVQQMAKDPRPKIVGGDLNATASQPPVRALRAAGLGDAWAVGQGSGFSAPAARPRVRIDFILHDGWFQPVQSAVLASAVSDHRAVWTRLQLREELDCFKVGAG